MTIRVLTPDDDIAGIGRMLVDGYQSLPESPDDPEYYAELADVATRIERSTRRRAPDELHAR